MTARRALVSGASGFIGRWAVPPLIASGYEVHAIVSLEFARELPGQLEGAVVHRVDLLDPEAIRRLIETVEPTHLLHFAWIATPGVYWTSPDNERWLVASEVLLRHFQARGGRRVVMVGTCAEYDWSRGGVCNERGSPLADDGGAIVTPYARCKLALSRVLERTGRDFRLSTAWGRIFFQFGPAEHHGRLVASVICNLLSGREAACSHGRQIRSFLHVADVGAACAALLNSDVEGPVNVGSAQRVSIAELLGEIAGQIGRPDLLRFGALSILESEPPLLVPDTQRLTQELGWQPRFDLAGGIADTVAWWRGVMA